MTAAVRARSAFARANLYRGGFDPFENRKLTTTAQRPRGYHLVTKRMEAPWQLKCLLTVSSVGD